MSLFSMIFGRKRAARDEPTTEPSRSGRHTSAETAVAWREGSYPMEVVGESHYQDALIAICGRHTRHGIEIDLEATIVLDPTNAHDPNAVSVKINDRPVGYLPREQAARVSRQMRDEDIQRARCRARVRGGWRTNQYDEGHYGVMLAIPRSGRIDFGNRVGPNETAPAQRAPSPTRPVAAADGPLQGHWVAIQGERSDGAIAQRLAGAGATIMASVGKSTTLLVVAEEEPFSEGIVRSAMYRKAELNGIRIVSRSTAIKMAEQ